MILILGIGYWVLGIGYAKPVPVNPDKLQNRKWDMALVALAGPLSNLIMAILFFVILRLVPKSSMNYSLLQFISYTAFINISLTLFNLLPIPPLDGSKVFGIVLSDKAYDWFLNKGGMTVVVLFVAIMLLGRMGYSPVGMLTTRVYDFFYRLIVLGRIA